MVLLGLYNGATTSARKAFMDRMNPVPQSQKPWAAVVPTPSNPTPAAVILLLGQRDDDPDAADAAQSFQADVLLQRRLLASADPGAGRVRALLLTALRPQQQLPKPETQAAHNFQLRCMHPLEAKYGHRQRSRNNR